MNRRSKLTPQVYVVAWPAVSLVKVGYSGARRWRSFVGRGGALARRFDFADGLAALRFEQLAHEAMRSFPLAFSCRGAAVEYLGGTGGGWMECYRCPLDDALPVIDEALARHCDTRHDAPSQCRVTLPGAMHATQCTYVQTY